MKRRKINVNFLVNNIILIRSFDIRFSSVFKRKPDRNFLLRPWFSFPFHVSLWVASRYLFFKDQSTFFTSTSLMFFILKRFFEFILPFLHTWRNPHVFLKMFFPFFVSDIELEIEFLYIFCFFLVSPWFNPRQYGSLTQNDLP